MANDQIHKFLQQRERTEFEEWVLQAMLGIEEAAMRRNRINSITKAIPGVTDDVLSAINSTSIIVAILISIVITVTR